MENGLIFFALRDAALAGIAATAFAFCLGVPRRFTLLCGICAALGHSTQAVLLHEQAPLGFATLAGSTLIGFLGLFFSHRLFVPRVVFTVPGILPMLPGTFIFNALYALIQTAALGINTPPTVALEAFSNLTRAAIILCALAVGIALPNLFLYYHKGEV